MFTVEHHVGRLGEIRFDALRSEDMSLYRVRFTQLLQDVRGKLVFCSDLRAAESVSREVEQQGVSLMRAATPRIERAAMLVSPRSKLGVQMLRAILSTDSHVRRAFQDPADAARWLDEVLDAAERRRLRAFL